MHKYKKGGIRINVTLLALDRNPASHKLICSSILVTMERKSVLVG